MTRSFSLFALSILFLSRLAASLEVSPGSTCAPLCIDSPGLNASDPRSSQTFTDDLVCTEDQYSSTDQGKKFKSCVDCLITSNHVDAATGESDLYWALYNLKFAFDYCILDVPTNPDLVNPNACSVSCTPFQNALTSGIPSDNTSTPIYQYCQNDNGIFVKSVATCAFCLTQTPNTIYPTNFILTLEAACIQTPQPGHLLNFQGEIFSDNQITFAKSSPQSTTKPTTSHGLSTGAKAGIAVAAVVVVAAILGLLYILYVRKRRRSMASQSEASKPAGRHISGPIQSWTSDRTSGASSNTAMEKGAVVQDHDREIYSPHVNQPNLDPEQLSPHALYHRPGLLYSSNPNSPRSPRSPKYGTEEGSNVALRTFPSGSAPGSPGQPSPPLPVSPRPLYRMGGQI